MLRAIGLIFVATLVTGPQSAWALANPASVFCAKRVAARARFARVRAANTACACCPTAGWWTSGAYFRAMRGKSAR